MAARVKGRKNSSESAEATPNADEPDKMQKAELKRLQAEGKQVRCETGLWFLDEAANKLAEDGTIPVERWLKTIFAAVESGKLPLRNPTNYEDALPYTPRLLRSWYDLVHYTALNTWLDANPAWTDFRFKACDAATSKSNQPAALTKREVLAASWPCNVNLHTALTDVPGWLKSARVHKAEPGSKRSSTWDPTMIGVCLCERKRAEPKKIDAHIRQHFTDWYPRWQELSEHL